MPLGHLGVNISDVAAAKAYFDELMPMLEFEPFFATDTEFSYKPAGGKVGTWVFFYGALEAGDYSHLRVGLGHLAFVMRTRDAVDGVAEWARRQGNELVHEPREWPEYGPGYYATFWLGPDGVMLEAVCHKLPDA